MECCFFWFLVPLSIPVKSWQSCLLDRHHGVQVLQKIVIRFHNLGGGVLCCVKCYQGDNSGCGGLCCVECCQGDKDFMEFCVVSNVIRQTRILQGLVLCVIL